LQLEASYRIVYKRKDSDSLSHKQCSSKWNFEGGIKMNQKKLV